MLVSEELLQFRDLESYIARMTCQVLAHAFTNSSNGLCPGESQGKCAKCATQR